MRKIAWMLLGLLCLAGCTSMRPMSPTSPEMGDLKPGQRLRIHMKDGTVFEDRFDYRVADTLRCESRRYALADIQFLERAKVDAARTTGAIVGGVAGTAVTAVAITAVVLLIGFLSLLSDISGGG